MRSGWLLRNGELVGYQIEEDALCLSFLTRKNYEHLYILLLVCFHHTL